VTYRRDQVEHPLDGFGALLPPCEGRDVLGILFPSSLFENRAPDGHICLTAFIGGALRPELTTLPEDQQLKKLQDTCAQLLGVSGQPTQTHCTRWPKAIPQYTFGHRERLAAAEAVEAEYPGLFLGGNWRGGIALGQCINSGLKLADRVTDYLKQHACKVDRFA
jgi:oxygen-dependent protoporphyrinogen oxidase